MRVGVPHPFRLILEPPARRRHGDPRGYLMTAARPGLQGRTFARSARGRPGDYARWLRRSNLELRESAGRRPSKQTCPLAGSCFRGLSRRSPRSSPGCVATKSRTAAATANSSHTAWLSSRCIRSGDRSRHAQPGFTFPDGRTRSLPGPAARPDSRTANRCGCRSRRDRHDQRGNSASTLFSR